MTTDHDDQSHPGGQNDDSVSLSLRRRINEVNDQFEVAWREGQEPRLEQCLKHFSESEHGVVLRRLLPVELDYRRRRGNVPTPGEYQDRFPSFGEVISVVFDQTAPQLSDPSSRDPVEASAKVDSDADVGTTAGEP